MGRISGIAVTADGVCDRGRAGGGHEGVSVTDSGHSHGTGSITVYNHGTGTSVGGDKHIVVVHVDRVTSSQAPPKEPPTAGSKEPQTEENHWAGQLVSVG